MTALENIIPSFPFLLQKHCEGMEIIILMLCKSIVTDPINNVTYFPLQICIIPFPQKGPHLGLCF